MPAMEQFTEAFCEKAISAFIILVPEINGAEREAREAALEAMRDCCMGIIERVRSEVEEAPWLAVAFMGVGFVSLFIRQEVAHKQERLHVLDHMPVITH